jgi:zinc D-Ala-D-Ala dipeptidase
LKLLFQPALYLLFFCCQLNAQPAVVIATYEAYKKTIMANAKNEMIDLKKLIPSIVLDLKYSTKDNFTNKKLYQKANTTYMRMEPALALQEVQFYLKSLGYGLKIFDAYRPYAATQLMWALIQDERYVANPKTGSGHNRGTTVDLTLIDLKTGNELPMGTAFDNFTDSSHHSFTSLLPEQITKNRNLLKSTMLKFGFKALETEWWHYGWISTDVYDVMDLSFKMLNKKNK